MCGKKREPPPRNLDPRTRTRRRFGLRPDPELVKVSLVPLRHRVEESCPSAAAKAAPVAFLILVAARTGTRRGVAKNTPARYPARHDDGPGWVDARKELELLG